MSEVLQAASPASDPVTLGSTSALAGSAPAGAIPADRLGTAAHAAGALVLRATLTRWYLIGATAVIAVALALTLVLRAPRTYTARSSFSTESRRSGAGAGLAGLAAQFGLGGGDAAGSPAFYLDLLESPLVLGRVVDATYTLDNGRRGRFAELLKVRGLFPADTRVAAMHTLVKHFTAVHSPKTGLIKLAVTTESPALSKQLADTLLATLNDFNLRRRQTQAGEERRFVERRLTEARAEVRDAEDRLRAFLSSNRLYETSPDLILQHDRLQREVLFQQALLTTLAQSYEVARVDEVRDTPLISIVEPPEVPPLPDPRRPWALSFFAGLAGTLAGLALAVWRTRAADRRSPRAAASDQARAAYRGAYG